ncbi:hypothetical protein MMC18_009305 [Xylographa bjoerkii]|nr:hypothetical protein [Xylographa bjoerkii]
MPCKNCRRYADVLGLNGETVIEHSLLPDLPVTRAERQKPQPVESRSALFLNAARESRLEEPAFLPTTTYTAGFSRSTYGAHSVKIHNEVLEFDRTFDNPAESQEMVTTATSSSTGWSCGEIVQTTALPATVPVSQQLWNADHITLQLEQLKVEEVRNVHPADFLALFKTDGLRSINELLISAIPAVGLADTPSIWYNSHKQTVKLKGPAGVIEQARTRLETGLKDIYCRAGLQHILGPHSKWSSALAKQYGSASKISVNRKSDQKPPKRIFDLRANEEDGKLVALWTRHISPALHGILSPRLGQNYAASFVRLGSSEASAHAYIRIQSECRQSQSIKAEIRAEIAKICDAVEQCHVVSQFSVGKVVLLGKSSIASSSGDEGCENDDTDLCDFPWYKRWWEKPGMGASIGLRCSNSVSATLGGYVVINNQPYLLTVDHFIDKARRHQDGATATTLDPLALTSPSLLDVKDMIASLEQSIRNVKADIAKLFNNLGSQDLLLDCMQQLYDDGGDLRQWYDILDFFDTLLKELRKDEQQFVLGRVEYRCVLKAREPSSYNETPLPYSDENPIVHRMDWALCRVNSARWGVNRHRYGSDKVPMDYLCPNTEPHGLGELCQDTCDPESYTHVYFVGQKSGINHGRIGSSLTNCCVNGIPTREWSIIVPHPVSDENIFAGDSGAWILRERDHRVVGQLWGYKDGLLLFTAINVIFADIMDSLGTRNVGLQNRYLNPDTSTIYNDSAMDNPALICEYKKPKQRKPKGYRISPGTTMMPRKTSLKIGPRLAFSDILSVVTPFEPAIPNNCAAADIVPGSPVPSLASSASSSTGPGPKTPDDCHDTKIERRSLSGLDLLAQLAKHHVNTRTDNRDEIEVAANDERDSTIYSIQAPRDRPHDDMADKTDKHSLSFILRDVQPEMKFNSIHLPDLYPFTGFRKSHTFPMYNEPLKPQPQTSVTAVA